ncbi:unnamed protein product [Ilex paraguariensis]|uniref:PRLI-interacting factor A n=1 Tax=Ilex paraguariensis TaxID=185542 RepID=A0ABC8UVP8_9AQUA
MNDQSKMMNQANQMLSMSQQQMLNQHPSQVMNQRPHLLNISESSQMMLNESQPQVQAPTMMMMNQQQSQQPQMMNRSYGMWPPPMDQVMFQNPMNPPASFVSSKQSMPLGPRSNWKGKKGSDKRQDGRRKEKAFIAGTSSVVVGGGVVGGGGGYKPPTLKDLQQQNRLKARKFYSKKKFNNNYNNRSAPFAPRNTTSFLIRAKKSGGIASLVSPYPVTPAVLPTPIFSPSREVLVDMAKEEWGVDGYGSMKGLIRLRSPGNDVEGHEDDEEEEGGSSESDVEEHVEVERRLDHDLSRFEMIYPNYSGEYNNVLENRVDDQDSHIGQLEEENLILKERLFLMERELGDLRRRLNCLERQNHGVEEINEEVVDNVSENESESRGEGPSIEGNNEEMVEGNNEGGLKVEAKMGNTDGSVEAKEENNNANVKAQEDNDDGKDETEADSKTGNLEAKEENNDGNVASENEVVADVFMEQVAHAQDEMIVDNGSKDEGRGNGCSEKGIGVGLI